MELCHLDADWQWHVDGLSQALLWHRLPKAQEQHMQVPATREVLYIYQVCTGGPLPYRMVMNDNDELFIFENIRRESVLIKPVGPDLLVSVHADVLEDMIRYRGSHDLTM